MLVGFAKEFVEILAEDVEGGEGVHHIFQVRKLIVRDSLFRNSGTKMLDQVIILPPASSRLTVKTGKRDKIDNLVRIFRRNPLIFNLRVVIYNDSHLLQDVLDLRRSLHNLAIFFCDGINLTADVQEQISVTTGERLEVALVNRHELIRFKEVLFKQKILLPEDFGEDLTKKGLEGKLDPVIGRGKEIERVIEILSRRTKNNPCLIGEPGVGKTAIVEGLAQKINSGDD